MPITGPKEPVNKKSRKKLNSMELHCSYGQGRNPRFFLANLVLVGVGGNGQSR